MTRRVLVATRLALLLIAVTTAAGCTHAPQYHLKVDNNQVAPFKPADPDDLVVDDGSDDDDDDDKPGGDAGEE